MICWKCKKEIEINEVFRTSECPECGTDLHCCRACKFYAPGNHYDCKENVDDVVTDKEKSNFCDYFSKNLNISATATDSDKAKAARDAFNSLFG